jgi:polar amino acid transport system permease protein
MEYCPGLKPRRSKYYKPVWNIVFYVALVLIGLFFFFATTQIDYSWRWNRIFEYFPHEGTVDVRTEVEGEITSIKIEGEQATVTVEGGAEKVSYKLPANAVQRDEGDYMYPGDTIGIYKRWYLGLFFDGMWLTLYLSVVSIFFGILLGLIAGLFRLSDNPALKNAAIVYIELIRGTPLLVQLYIWYFVLGTLINNILVAYAVPFKVPDTWYGAAGLTCFAGAYVAEIVRSGIESIHPGQLEAARSLGMSAYEAMRHIILPQAFRRILPPLAGQFISLIKDSSLLSIIAIRELTKAAREAVTTSLMPFEIWFVCGLLYLVLTFTLSLVVKWMERRTVLT